MRKSELKGLKLNPIDYALPMLSTNFLVENYAYNIQDFTVGFPIFQKYIDMYVFLHLFFHSVLPFNVYVFQTLFFVMLADFELWYLVCGFILMTYRSSSSFVCITTLSKELCLTAISLILMFTDSEELCPVNLEIIGSFCKFIYREEGDWEEFDCAVTTGTFSIIISL